jgi:hypothetical protein
MKMNCAALNTIRLIWVAGLCLLIGCDGAPREMDFVSQQFVATFNVDSTKGIDSISLPRLMNSKAIYNFSDGGTGTYHLQMGMLSKDTPITWELKGDSLFIDKKPYTIRKEDQAFILKSDSVKIILSKQKG